VKPIERPFVAPASGALLELELGPGCGRYKMPRISPREARTSLPEAYVLQELESVYKKHIALKESEIYPLAGRVLRQEELIVIGRGMAARLGIDLKAYDQIQTPSR